MLRIIWPRPGWRDQRWPTLTWLGRPADRKRSQTSCGKANGPRNLAFGGWFIPSTSIYYWLYHLNFSCYASSSFACSSSADLRLPKFGHLCLCQSFYKAMNWSTWLVVEPPPEKFECVSWDDEIPHFFCKNIKHVSNHHPATRIDQTTWGIPYTYTVNSSCRWSEWTSAQHGTDGTWRRRCPWHSQRLWHRRPKKIKRKYGKDDEEMEKVMMIQPENRDATTIIIIYLD